MREGVGADPNALTAACMQQVQQVFGRLHAEVHAAALLRHTVDGRRRWRAAAEAFHAFANPLDALWSSEVAHAIQAGSGPWRDAALTLLEVSPRYFRSGYLRDHVCHILKQCEELSAADQARMLQALLAGIERRPSVGCFRYDCRLAMRWHTPQFLAQLSQLATRKDGWSGGRARRMRDAVLRQPCPCHSHQIRKTHPQP